jgi:hypothetical protein
MSQRARAHAAGAALVGAGVLVAALVAAQPARSLGPAVAGIGPASAGFPGGTVATTTTTASTVTSTTSVGISWVPSMLGVWMLDEAGTVPRVNAQGTAARDLTVIGCGPGSVTSSTTDKMEGAASMGVPANGCGYTTDGFGGFSVPFSVGCWAKKTASGSAGAFLLHDWSAGANTFRVSKTATETFSFQLVNAAATPTTITTTATYPAATWSHVVATASAAGPLVLYVNGVQQVTGSYPTPASAAAGKNFMLGENATWAGQLDECFLSGQLLSAAAVCRICSCGVRGELCACSGTAFTVTGRNASACGACTLPADCSASTPP